MSNGTPLPLAAQRLVDDIGVDLERRVCSRCDGAGSHCWFCDLSFADCTCGPHQEPGTCETCEGEGLDARGEFDDDGDAAGDTLAGDA